MHFLYILKSLKDGSHYTGISRNVDIRLKEHNRGKNRSTKHRLPFKIVYTEEFKTRPEARQREKFFKSGEGRELRDQILMGR